MSVAAAAHAEARPFINLKNVRKVYRSGGEEFVAVSDVTMAVAQGELVSLVGPSGCGKTTVLKILADLHGHDGGTVEIGDAAHPFTPGRDVGMVFQQPLLLKWRTIIDNVLLPAEILGLPMKEARERARDDQISSQESRIEEFAECVDLDPFDPTGRRRGQGSAVAFAGSGVVGATEDVGRHRAGRDVGVSVERT